jgi:aspartyl protease family protein
VGLTYVEADVTDVLRAHRKRIRFLVDSGAIYTVVPRPILRAMGVKPERTERFELADGTSIRRQVGTARFRIGRRTTASDVIFGGSRDEPLLGALTLEGLGLELDPTRRLLKPTRLLLAGYRRH